MVDTVAQFNLQFEPVEDRLYLSIKTQADNEVKIWLTRRYVKLLFNAIDQQQGMIAKHFHNIEVSPIISNKQTTDNQSDNAVNDSLAVDEAPISFDINTAQTNRPSMSDEPILVTRISLQEQSNGQLNLVFGQEQKGSMQMELGLNHELLHTLMHLLDEAAKNADWDLALFLPDMLAKEAPQGARLH